MIHSCVCVCVVVPKHSREGFRLYLLFVKCRKEQGDKIGKRSLNVCQDRKIWLFHCFNMLSFQFASSFQIILANKSNRQQTTLICKYKLRYSKSIELFFFAFIHLGYLMLVKKQLSITMARM